MNGIVHENDRDTVRIAAVRYLNTVPLIEGLSALSSLEVTTAAPAQIAGLVESRRADLGLASIVDALRCPTPLAIVPVGMIGCDGPTLTVRVFSATPIEDIKTLHADTESHTSVMLARVLLKRVHGIDVVVVGFDARCRAAAKLGSHREFAMGAASIPGEIAARGPDQPHERENDDAVWPTALLLIGDKVVSSPPPAELYPYQLDLGEAWKSWTGLPFVYATWMCRADEIGSPYVARAAALLDRQLRHNLTRLDWIIATRSPQHHWPAALARHYLGGLLRYRVGPREKQAIARFFEELCAMGLANHRDVAWLGTPE